MATSQRLTCKNCHEMLQRVDILRVSPGAEVAFRIDTQCPKCHRDNVYDLFLKSPEKKLTPARSAR